jgi:Family of unknown function (DUF5682)
MLLGNDRVMTLVHDKLVVGEALGTVPASVPVVPLQRDIEAKQRRLRLRPRAESEVVTLDLRKDRDREKSRLLRALRILDIGWGRGGERGDGLGTFKELWQLRWEPELSMCIIEAAPFGNTVETAAQARATVRARELDSLAALATLARESLLAELDMAPIVARLADVAALASDIGALMDALPALISILRYGDVRGDASDALEPLVRGTMARISVGLVAACCSLDHDAAATMHDRIDALHDALGLLARDDLDEAWLAALERAGDDERVHGLLRGRACRLLLDRGRMSADEVSRRLGVALSVGEEPAIAAAWLDGMLRHAGQLLLLDDRLWSLVDRWLTSLPNDTFEELLPLVRRCFSSFTEPERQRLGERVRHGAAPQTGPKTKPSDEPGFDHERAALVLPLVESILGGRLARLEP